MAGDGRVRLSVFKGREARLNRAMFWILAFEGPLTIYDICKRVRTQRPFRRTGYSVVNRKVRMMESLGYVERIGTRRTKAGFEAFLFQLTTRTYLAILLNQIDLDTFIGEADEAQVLSVLGVLASLI